MRSIYEGRQIKIGKLIAINTTRLQRSLVFPLSLLVIAGSFRVTEAAASAATITVSDTREAISISGSTGTPHVTPTPNASEPPHVTPTPHASETPHLTPTPHPSEPPHVTPTPNASEPPHVTPTPHASETPHLTPTPRPSEPPHVTPTPNASEPPHVTPTPHASETPHLTPTPHPSEPPHVTPTPNATEPPHVTPTPHASETPHLTPTPHPSEPPHVTPTPHASEPPHITPTPHATPTPQVAVQPLNISTRLHVEAGENVAIGGFMITGTSSKRIAIRGMGPSLQSAGFFSTALSDPILQLRDSANSLIASNDNWRDNSAWAAELEAMALAPESNFESAIVVTLQPGAYTAIVGGNNQSTGMGLVEVYDLDTAGDAQIANISTRGFVRTGDEVVIGGFIIGGNTGQATVLLRATGPSLNTAGVASALANPTLELRDNDGVLLQQNDDWIDTQRAAIEATGLAPQNNVEAAILATLLPGSYTAIAAGKDGSVGVALIELYNLPSQ